MRNTFSLGISTPDLIKEFGTSWVLRRQRITCKRWPKLGEDVSILTAPTGFNRGLQTYRDFHLLDSDDETTPIISAVSEWLLMDVESRRLKPIPEKVLALATDLAPAASHLGRPTSKLQPPTEPSAQLDFKVRYGMLDFNNHLTNPVFPELMLEPLGADFLRTHVPNTVDIMYHHEARYGELVTATVGTVKNDSTHHALYRGEELLAVMEVDWQPLPTD